MNEIATVDNELSVLKIFDKKFYNNGFERVNSGEPETIVERFGVISRLYGVDLLIERKHADNLYPDYRLKTPKFMISVHSEDVEQMKMKSVAGETSFDYNDTRLRHNVYEHSFIFIVPEKFHQNFKRIMNGELAYNNDSFVLELIKKVKDKSTAGQHQSELVNWWNKVGEIYDIDPEFSPDDIPAMAKDVDDVIKALKVKAKIREEEEIERRKRARWGLEENSAITKAAAIDKVLGSDPQVLDRFTSNALALTRGSSIDNPYCFKVVGENQFELFPEEAKFVASFGNFAILSENEKSASIEGRERDFILSRCKEKKDLSKKVQEDEIHLKELQKSNRKRFGTGGLALVPPAIILLLVLNGIAVNLLLVLLVIIILPCFGFSFYNFQDVVANTKKAQHIELYRAMKSVTHDFVDWIIIPKSFAQKIHSFMNGSSKFSGYSLILDVLETKIDSKQDAGEIELWLNAVDSITEMDSTFPLDMIPAMSDNAVHVRDTIKKKIDSEARKESAAAEEEQVIESDRNEMAMDSMRQESEAVTAGALALIGAVEENDSSVPYKTTVGPLEERLV